MRSIKKPVSVTLAAALLISVCSCSDTSTLTSTDSFDYRWVDSNLFENLDLMAQADLKDDFAAAVNYEWSAAQTRDLTYKITPFGLVEKTVVQNKRALIEDPTVQSKNIELIRTADGLFCDWEYRDSLGVEPLKKYLDYIDEIEDLDDVSAYMIDNDRNPFALSIMNITYSTYADSDGYRAVYLYCPSLSLEESKYYYELSEDAYKQKESVESQVRYLLDRCGYSEKEINNTISGCYRIESKLLYSYILDEIDDYEIKNKDEILELAGNFPLEMILEHYHLNDCERFCGQLPFVDHIESVYTQSNVEAMKSYFKMQLALKSIRFLDAGAYDCYRNSSLDRTNPYAERIDKDPDYNFFDIIHESPLNAAMDQAYIDYYFDQNVYDDVETFIHTIKDKYRILIAQNENLSDESKEAVFAKLDKMGENIIRPSNTADFTGVELKSREEGGSFLDAMCILSRIEKEHIADMVQVKTGKDFWDIYNGQVSTTLTNAFYHPVQNCVYVQIGILVEPAYKYDESFEWRLAYFGTIIGHELSHAFDSTGIYYDADGKFNNVVTTEELQIWQEMAGRISTHLSSFEPFEGSGSYTLMSPITGEAIADIEGVRVCLLLARDHEGFDYDLFFRSYAEHWERMDSKQNQMDAIRIDTHPLMYIRCNYTLMQFEEFYEIYDIQPGDGMYLAPEQRIVIW